MSEPTKQRSLREAARQGAPRATAAPAAVPPLASAVPAPAKKLKPPPSAMVTFSCGHHKPAAAFKSSACGECRAKARKERVARQRAKDAEKQAASEASNIGRLPHGSVKTLTYDADAKLWNGVLTVPGEGEFRFSASGEKATFHGLDGLYRDSKQFEPPERPSLPPASD